MKSSKVMMQPLLLRMRYLILAMMLIASLIVSRPIFAQAIDSAPDSLVKTIVTEVMSSIKGDKEIQSGNISKVIDLVDTKIVPYTDFRKTTQLAVGRNWSRATPEQQNKIIAEFKTLLIRTYAGALTQIRDQTVVYKPFRMDPADTEVIVRTQIMNKGDLIQLDYRLTKQGDSWKLYDINVLGAWLIEAYRGQFITQINASGIDGLIKFLEDRNASLAKAK
jgi:phospholipid transport system substrate-binding protein